MQHRTTNTPLPIRSEGDDFLCDACDTCWSEDDLTSTKNCPACQGAVVYLTTSDGKEHPPTNVLVKMSRPGDQLVVMASGSLYLNGKVWGRVKGKYKPDSPSYPEILDYVCELSEKGWRIEEIFGMQCTEVKQI